MARIEAKNLCIDFPVGKINLSLRSTLKASVGGVLRRGKKEERSGSDFYISALEDINLSLKSGDKVGLIGHNGAGKSTLLQTLNRGYFPTSGSLSVEGKVVPLLNLGNGAVPDFNGYDNIELLALHMGMSREEIAGKIDDIVAFTELGDYLNVPIRTYSSGMYLRLSFAIATAADPDILLIDELFGAGDQNFYKKAERRMEALMERSGILVFATHAIPLIEQYCNKAIVLNHGRIEFYGDVDQAINYYNGLAIVV